METTKLRLAATETLKLPFVADEKKLSLWLSSLSTSQSIPASEQILQVVQSINGLDLKAELKIKLLLRIFLFLPIIVEALQKTYLDKSFPLSEASQQNVDRVINTYLEIAQALRNNLFAHPSPNKDLQVLSLHLSLDVLAQALLHISFSYHQGMPGFWQQCYTIYAYAEQANLLKLSCTYPNTDTQAKANKPLNIDAKFKHLLLYFLCDTQQFRAREQQMIFRHLPDFAHEATILTSIPSNAQQGGYTFNLQADKAPHKILAQNENTDRYERFIGCLRVAKNLYASVQQKSDNSTLDLIYQNTLQKAASTLGLARKRKYTRIKKTDSYQGIIGFNHIIDFMCNRNSELANSVLQNTATATFEFKPKATFDLIPVGEEVAHQMRTNYNQPHPQSPVLGKIFTAGNGNPAYSNSSATNDSSSCELVILDSSVKGYGLVTGNKTADVKIGDILGLTIPNSENIEISLIRRINQLADHNLHIGVEVLSFQSELVFITRKGQPLQGIWAIFIPEIASLKQPSSLIFNGSLITINDIIAVKFSNSNQYFSLQKVLLTTPAIALVQLAPVAG